MSERFTGIDVGVETIKIVEVRRDDQGVRWVGHACAEHHKSPGTTLQRLLDDWPWNEMSGAAVSGRLAPMLRLPRIPAKRAQAAAFRYLHGEGAGTLVCIGGHGFSVLELRDSGLEVYRENGRCSQGTGNFLRQLVGRLDLSVDQASALCERVEDPVALSGRCPVILKTDMTHLANRGERRERILAGLYDAVCANVQVLFKPRTSQGPVVLVGGVTRSRRVRDNFARFLDRFDMALAPWDEDVAIYCDALGTALMAAEQSIPLPPLQELIVPPEASRLDRVPALRRSLDRVRRMPQQALADPLVGERRILLGFDIGSTGSKAVALDADSRERVWHSYLPTNGNPVRAAQRLLADFTGSTAERHLLLACAVTGSGREIVGSLLSTCYGCDAVFILNEIAAHAEGALFHDPRVDTIFEIGGQDAKYIRLVDGRVVDAAMNEACSAGTGSFIAEQGGKFAGIGDVTELGRAALDAAEGVSLGQHCSVFMAEIIDEGVASGAEQASIIAGIFDSVVQNYLNRVKGNRSVGRLIFCQGMPFAADALAAAVARQTGSEVIVPPDPGNIGALGIGLLALRELVLDQRSPLDPGRFLSATVTDRDDFVCRSTRGCGEPGSKCRIDRITTQVADRRRRFDWGGGCALYERVSGRLKLPDRAPDPFHERTALVQTIIDRVSARSSGPRVAMTDEFMLKGLFPFFATLLDGLGCRVIMHAGAGRKALQRGIEEANVPFCAPMQQFHGLVGDLNDDAPDYLFLPMIRTIEHVGDEKHASVCPIAQGAPDLLQWNLAHRRLAEIFSPVIDFGKGGLASDLFHASCRRIAQRFAAEAAFSAAFRAASAAQQAFDAQCQAFGQKALDFCRSNGTLPVIVLGRPYTIHNPVLNANLPSILREQGAIAIPVDCYPVAAEVPVYAGVYWGYGQRNLRAACQIRRRSDEYALYCSNYSCGPDSFDLHFFAYLMEGKPYAVIETDGHAGDAGTRTRVEAFLYCVQSDRGTAPSGVGNDLDAIMRQGEGLDEIKRQGKTVLVPRMGPAADVLAACLRGIGVPAESLPLPTRATLALGRRHTSGKECLPMTMTLGALLERIEQERDSDRLFSFFMPTANGPCRFGVYHLLHKIILERLGWKARVGFWSPANSGYFDGIPPGFATIVFTGFVASDLLLEALCFVRPVEREPGSCQRIHDRYRAELIELLQREAAGDLSVGATLLRVATGDLFGCLDLLRRAADAFASAMTDKTLPTVSVVGEIYVRCDPFANDFVIEQLERRGIRSRLAPFSEWLEYTDQLKVQDAPGLALSERARSRIQVRIQDLSYKAVASRLGWPARTKVRQALAAARPFIRPELRGEAALTVGGPLHQWRLGDIDGQVSVGPLECLPNKIAEAQLFHVAEQEGMPSLTLSLNGDPVAPGVIDQFAFEVHEGFRKRRAGG